MQVDQPQELPFPQGNTFDLQKQPQQSRTNVPAVMTSLLISIIYIVLNEEKKKSTSRYKPTQEFCSHFSHTLERSLRISD